MGDRAELRNKMLNLMPGEVQLNYAPSYIIRMLLVPWASGRYGRRRIYNRKSL